MKRSSVRFLGFLGIGSLLVIGCQSGNTQSAAERAMGTPAAARGTPEAGDDALPANLVPGTLPHAAFLAGARHAKGWQQSGNPFEGELAVRGRQSQMVLLRYGRCYRFVGAAGPDIEDLDLVLYDPDEIPLQRDLSQDNLPVLGLQAHICPQRTTTYRLEVLAYAGSGPFLVQAYESPH